MAKRIHEVRKEIFEALADVPEGFADIRDYLDIYKNLESKQLNETAAAFFTSSLRVLQRIMRYFGKHPFSAQSPMLL